jgi:hypothetical protein
MLFYHYSAVAYCRYEDKEASSLRSDVGDTVVIDAEVAK